MPELNYTLINTNQLCQFHTQVQYNPYHSTEPMNITNPSVDFTACLEFQETNIFLNTCFFNSDRPSRIPTYRIDFTPTVESTSNCVPSTKYYARRRLRRKMCLVLASNSINQLNMINVKLQMRRTSYSTPNILTRDWWLESKYQGNSQ